MHGGKRAGAGRKKGTITKATETRKAIALKALAEGISPLDVMLRAMRAAWEEGDMKSAVASAKEAAPYVHPRLASVEHSGDMNVNVHESRLGSIVGAAVAAMNGADHDQAN